MESVEFFPWNIGICGIETQHKTSDRRFGKERTEIEERESKRN